MIRQAALHRCVAWLALAAMALIVVMPAASRFIPVDNAMADMDGGCAMYAGNHLHPGIPGYPDDPTARCGYCTLLGHTPVVGLGMLLLHLPALRPTSPLPAAASQSAPFARLLSARSRGPPSRMDA